MNKINYLCKKNIPMKKIALSAIALLITIISFSQIYLWKNGEIIGIHNDVDSITFEKPTIIPADSIFFKTNRKSWSYDHPLKNQTPDFTTSTDTIRLHFFGWSLDDDSVITVKFPESTDKYNRAILTYRMGGWNEGPAEWDITTMIMIKDKRTGELYELVRAFTPYGGAFDTDWEKIFYIDITEYLPMLTNDVEFYIYYGGWDATEQRAHTVKLRFEFYEGKRDKTVVFSQKIYNSRSSSNTGYRSWAYGVDTASIEEPERLGIRTIKIPYNVKSLLLKVSITGHGADPGIFPNRPDYQQAINAAEFDDSRYTIIINNDTLATEEIFQMNLNNYYQKGSYRMGRANWGPGLPMKTDYWELHQIPENRTLNINFDLEPFKSAINNPKAEGIANYIIEIDLFGYNSH